MFSGRVNVNSLATKALIEKGYDRNDILEGIHDVNERLSWKRHSSCLLYSRKYRKWFSGQIIDILVDPQTKEKWLTVQYNENYTKRIQRFNKNIKPTRCDALIPIVAFYAQKLKTQSHLLTTKPTKTIRKKRKKKKKKKQRKYYSGLGIDSHSEPHKYWRSININVVKSVLYGLMHQYEAQYDIYIPDVMVQLMIKFYYHNKYVEIRIYPRFTPRYVRNYVGIGQPIDGKLEIEQNALFQFYSSRCPHCNKATVDNQKALHYEHSLRGEYSSSTMCRNNANMYGCLHCGYNVIVNVKDYFFYSHFRIRSQTITYKCFVTPFGTESEMQQIAELGNPLDEAYPKSGQCHECDMDTIELCSTRYYDGYLSTQTRYCSSCGLFHQEQRDTWADR